MNLVWGGRGGRGDVYQVEKAKMGIEPRIDEDRKSVW